MAAAAAEDSLDLKSVLSSSERDFLVRNNGDQVKLSELVGKAVGLYFSASWCGPCRNFTPKLVEAYNELLPKGVFELVFISADEDEESFNSYFSKMPWLAVPFTDSATRDRLDEHFSVRGIPHLVIIDADGNVITEDGVQLIRDYGAESYPFTSERVKVLEEEELSARENQTLKSLLSSNHRDYLITNDGSKIPVTDLVGKNICLYFSAHWCPPCRAFLPKLIKAYEEIKAKGHEFEVIYISSDRDQSSFEDYFATMPWLALPYNDQRKQSLSRTFKIQGIPSLVAIDANGRTITKEARELVAAHGSEAFPFTDEHLREMEARLEETAKSWPQKVNSSAHNEHELALTRRMNYVCDGCEEGGAGWSYFCADCDFDLHPKCALEETNQENGNAEDKSGNGGVVCEGGVCRRV